MTGLVDRPTGPRPPLLKVVALAVSLAWGLASAQPAPAPAVPAPAEVIAPPPSNSSLDALLFYQLLIGELELKEGRVGNAFEVILDAARRQSDDTLFQRAVEIALQARAGEQALAAAQAWRKARPDQVAPLRYLTQILLALNKVDETAEPLAAWLKATPAAERPGLIAGLPRVLQRVPDQQHALALGGKLLAPYLDQSDTRTAARVALGRVHLSAQLPVQALGLARAAQADDAAAPGPALLALDLLPATPEAEALVNNYLQRPDAEPAVRLAYVRMLTQSQRYADASRQLERLTTEQPQLPDPWLTLGALRLELKQPKEAEVALQRFIDLSGAPPAAALAAANAAGASRVASDTDDDDDAPAGAGEAKDLTAAWLLMAQAA